MLAHDCDIEHTCVYKKANKIKLERIGLKVHKRVIMIITDLLSYVVRKVKYNITVFVC
jgi:hypothetical protein